MSRPNFHVITGQHVTRILVEGVDSNYVVDNPTPGGNEDGNGMNGVTSNEGFGFGPGGSTPALDDNTTAGLLRRQSPSTSSLRITGVEVSHVLVRCNASQLTFQVRCQCLGYSKIHHCYTRGYRRRWFLAFCTALTTFWHWTLIAVELVWYPHRH